MTPHRKRLLCAEDEEDISLMIVSLLGLINLEVITATTFAEAWDKIRSEHFDLYLLDNWLPGGTGVTLCKRIRELDEDTPIVFYSGAAYESDRAEAMQAGAQEYLIKPSDVGRLVESIRRLLNLP